MDNSIPFQFAFRFITCIRVPLRLLVPIITQSDLPARIHLTSQETASEVERHVICDVPSKRLCQRSTIGRTSTPTDENFAALLTKLYCVPVIIIMLHYFDVPSSHLSALGDWHTIRQVPLPRAARCHRNSQAVSALLDFQRIRVTRSMPFATSQRVPTGAYLRACNVPEFAYMRVCMCMHCSTGEACEDALGDTGDH